MATPRPIDQSRANPVLYREKGNLSSRLNSPGPVLGVKPIENSAQLEPEFEPTNNKQGIVLNIPQHQRDDDEKTEKSDVISCAPSMANLDLINDTLLVNQKPRKTENNDGIKPTIETNVETERKKCDTGTVQETPILIEKNSDPEPSAIDTEAKTKKHQVTRELLSQMDTEHKAANQVKNLNEKIYNEDNKTVPDMDSEIQAVLRSQNVQELEIQPILRTHSGRYADEIEAVSHAQAQGGVFDLTQSVDIVDFELARRNAQAMKQGVKQHELETNHPSMSDVNGAVLRGKTCTPASAYTDASELKYLDDRSSQGPETKEAMFQQALTLMDERCVSRDSSRMMAQLDHRYAYSQPNDHSSYARSTTEASVIAARDDVETPLVAHKHHPYGINRPEYFYIHQRKPTPMEPLTAWKGYYGNVYFNPINVQQARAMPHPPPHAPDIDQCSDQLQNILIRGRRPVRHSKSVTSKRTTNTSITDLSSTSGSNPRNSASSRRGAVKRSHSVQSLKSVRSSAVSKSSNASRQMSLLDKRSVLSNFNENIEEDIQWLQGLESTGSLNVLKDEKEVQEQRKPTVTFEKDKICKGAALRQSQSAKVAKAPAHPEFYLYGGHCDKPTKNSLAVLRARPHYPFFNNNRHFPRGPNNSGIFSPQSYNSFLGSFESLPPLEQLQASLRRMGTTASRDELINMIPVSQRHNPSADVRKNPFVKFSPEFRRPHPPSRNIFVK